ncbi:Mac family protein [Mycoplasmopsis canis UFG4]|uniref:Mac family protein n=1 Tax=Mycoplasmopsis canis UFG4 TaxID=1131455 RepID=I1A771_9BACT|nr:IdeS/Mac family cysteine endopeptidase [Mycoplasmopsis canis]EIE42342.1 Mac family protein [Mycoplasmopsis canis UFG4]
MKIRRILKTVFSLLPIIAPINFISTITANNENNSDVLKNKLNELLKNNLAKESIGSNYSFKWINGIDSVNFNGLKVYKTELEDNSISGYLYLESNGQEKWFDANKNKNDIDQWLCTAAVVSNSLNWFVQQNKSNIESFYNEDFNKNSGKNITKLFKYNYENGDSGFFEYFQNILGKRSSNYDILIDTMINGYSYPYNEYKEIPDKKGGFFRDVFEKNRLTSKSGFGFLSVKALDNYISNAINRNNSLALSYKINNNFGHIVSLWGVDYKDGVLDAVYITDSDDKLTHEKPTLKRYPVRLINGKMHISTNYESDGQQLNGAEIYWVHELSNGKNYFNDYFKNLENNREKFVQKYSQMTMEFNNKINNDIEKFEKKVDEIKNNPFFSSLEPEFTERPNDIEKFIKIMNDLKGYAFEPYEYSIYTSKINAIILKYENFFSTSKSHLNWLNESYKNLMTFLENISVSEDGNDIPKSKTWIHKKDKELLDNFKENVFLSLNELKTMNFQTSLSGYENKIRNFEFEFENNLRSKIYYGFQEDFKEQYLKEVDSIWNNFSSYILIFDKFFENEANNIYQTYSKKKKDFVTKGEYDKYIEQYILELKKLLLSSIYSEAQIKIKSLKYKSNKTEFNNEYNDLINYINDNFENNKDETKHKVKEFRNKFQILKNNEINLENFKDNQINILRKYLNSVFYEYKPIDRRNIFLAFKNCANKMDYLESKSEVQREIEEFSKYLNKKKILRINLSIFTKMFITLLSLLTSLLICLFAIYLRKLK